MSLLFALADLSNELKQQYRRFPAKGSTLDIDFINNRNRVAGVYGDALNGVTATRTTTGTYFDATGTMQTAAINAPRFEYNPVSLKPFGLLIEESRANRIRNNTMQGAVAGTPGTGPTNWVLPGTSNGVTQTVVGTGTENGIAYVDVKYAGTPSTTSFIAIGFEPANIITASAGQTWTESAYLKLQSGSFANTATTLSIMGTDGTNSTFTQNSSIIASTPSNLSESRLTLTSTLTGASTTHVVPGVRIGYTSGLPIDITLRIGLPQMELGAFATSVIPTTGTAVTRGADVVSMTGTNFNSWYSQFGIVCVSEFSLLGLLAGQTVYHIGNGGLSDRISTRNEGVSIASRCIANETIQAMLTAQTVQAGTVLRHIFSVFENDFAVCGDSVFGFDAAGILPSPVSISIGNAYSSAFLNGHIRRLTAYPQRLPNNLLQYLSRLTA